MALKITFGILLILGAGVLLLIGMCGSLFQTRDVAVTGAVVLSLLLLANGIVMLVRCSSPTAPNAGAAAAVLLAIGVIGAFTGVLRAFERNEEATATIIIVGSGLCLLAGIVLISIRDKARIQREIEYAFYEPDDDDEEETTSDSEDEPRWDDS